MEDEGSRPQMVLWLIVELDLNWDPLAEHA